MVSKATAGSRLINNPVTHASSRNPSCGDPGDQSGFSPQAGLKWTETMATDCNALANRAKQQSARLKWLCLKHNRTVQKCVVGWAAIALEINELLPTS